MADIFISYAREDVERASHLVERFEGEGWSVFWDRRIPAGGEWPQILMAELAPARCVVVLWSKSSVDARWVREEANEGAERKILIPARLDPVEPPLGFRSVNACDLTRWDGDAGSPALEELVEEVARLIGRPAGVSVEPLTLAVVLGRPTKHPNLGAAVNLTCRFTNGLKRAVEVHGLTASALGPDERLWYDLDWTLLFDEVAGGAEHIRRIQRQTTLRIPGAGFKTGVQFRAPILTDVVQWPEGTYKFRLRGWVDRPRHDALPNLRRDFEATLDRRAVAAIQEHLEMPDEEWVRRRYSDDARGVPFSLSNVRPGVPATDRGGGPHGE